MATKYGKTVAQLALAWSLQEGFLPLPKSVTPERIASNLNCFDFELTADDMELLRHLPVEAGAPDPDTKDFKKEYLFINENRGQFRSRFLKSFQ